MTTVAYRAGVIAADTLVTEGSVTVSEITKIARNKHGDLAGAAGSIWWVQEFLEWFKAGTPAGKVPQGGGDGSQEAFIVFNKGAVLYFELADNAVRSSEITLSQSYFAIGSGSHFAVGAMAMGARAEVAISVAMTHDTNTGGSIESLSAKKERK